MLPDPIEAYSSEQTVTKASYMTGGKQALPSTPRGAPETRSGAKGRAASPPPLPLRFRVLVVAPPLPGVTSPRAAERKKRWRPWESLCGWKEVTARRMVGGGEVSDVAEKARVLEGGVQTTGPGGWGRGKGPTTGPAPSEGEAEGALDRLAHPPQEVPDRHGRASRIPPLAERGEAGRAGPAPSYSGRPSFLVLGGHAEVVTRRPTLTLPGVLHA